MLCCYDYFFMWVFFFIFMNDVKIQGIWEDFFVMNFVRQLIFSFKYDVWFCRF